MMVDTTLHVILASLTPNFIFLPAKDIDLKAETRQTDRQTDRQT